MKTSITNSNHEIQWRPACDIPNQAGFKLTIKREDGELINTVVIKTAQNIHTLSGISIGQIKGWIPNNEV